MASYLHMWERVSSLFYVIWFLSRYVHSSCCIKEMFLDEYKSKAKTQVVLQSQTWEFCWYALDWGRHKRTSRKSVLFDRPGFMYCGSDLNHKDVSKFLFQVAWRLGDVFCSVERPLGTADGEAWLGSTAERGYVPWKCVFGAWSFGIVLKQCSAAVPSEKIQCFFRWCDGEWMGRRWGFILSCGHQKAGGDRREAMGSCGCGREESRRLG